MTSVFIVSAPSGSGKSTLVNRLLEIDQRIDFSISYTTRSPRGAERDGENYHFISREDFERRLVASEFLEHAQVFGNYYGTHISTLEEARRRGHDLLLDIDVQGARQLKDRIPDAVSIFILAPSRQILEQRLRARSEDAESVIQRRLQGAADEIRNYGAYDYVVVNDQVDQSVATLKAIVDAERARRTRMVGRIQPILDSFQVSGTQI
jgi:guanylate kinase